MKRLWLFLTIISSVSPLWSGQNIWQDQPFTYDDRFSLQEFITRQLLIPIPRGTTVYASTFEREIPDTHVFSDTMNGVTFIECNLNNVFIPSGNIVKNFYRPQPIRFKAQNDLRDWEVGAGTTPLRLLDAEYWWDLGFSTDPADIPTEIISDRSNIPRR